MSYSFAKKSASRRLIFFKTMAIILACIMLITWLFIDGRTKVEPFDGTPMDCPELRRNADLIPAWKLSKNYDTKITFKSSAYPVEELQDKHKEDVVVQTNALGGEDTIIIALTNDESSYPN